MCHLREDIGGQIIQIHQEVTIPVLTLLEKLATFFWKRMIPASWCRELDQL